MTTLLCPVLLELPQNIQSRDLVEAWRRLHQPLEEPLEATSTNWRAPAEARNNPHLPILGGNFQTASKHAMMSLFRELATAADKL